VATTSLEESRPEGLQQRCLVVARPWAPPLGCPKLFLLVRGSPWDSHRAGTLLTNVPGYGCALIPLLGGMDRVRGQRHGILSSRGAKIGVPWQPSGPTPPCLAFLSFLLYHCTRRIELDPRGR
jgi:hypothetical protein